MFWVMCYDIVDDKRRRKVMKKMEGYGRRVQYSVFECELSKEQLDRLERELNRLIDETEDHIRVYPLNRADVDRIRLLGVARLDRRQSHYLI